MVVNGCNGYEDCVKSIAGRWRVVVKGCNGYEDCGKSISGRLILVVKGCNGYEDCVKFLSFKSFKTKHHLFLLLSSSYPGKRAAP